MVFIEKCGALIIGFLFFIASVLFSAIYPPNNNYLEVHFLDVGQGDSVFIQTPEGKSVLVDAGPIRGGAVSQVATLKGFFDRKIDVVVATHFDSDHIGGMIDIFEYFDVSLIIMPEWQDKSANIEYFLEAVKNEGAEIIFAERIEKLQFKDGVVLEFISPKQAGLYFSENQASIVAKLSYGDDSFLFAADIDKRIERSLAEREGNIKADVLKVAHHGSAGSSSKKFIEAVAPKIAIIQVGKNPYGHPKDEVLEALEGVLVLRNDQNGTISLYSDGMSF